MIVDFDKLLIGESDEIIRLQNGFESNGWCFIRLPDQSEQLTKKINEVQKILGEFFSRNQIDKSRYESLNAFGYFRVDHNEGIKILINQYGVHSYHRPLTNDIERLLKYLAHLFDNLTSILKSIIFKMPIFAQSSVKAIVPLSQLGILNIVHSFKQITGSVKQSGIGLNNCETNCVSPFDSSLFSLSILSTCDGLHLKEQLKHHWIDEPNNFIHDQRSIGVILLGEAASILSENRLKSVVYCVVSSRLPHQSCPTIWQQVCTEARIKSSLQQGDKYTLILDDAIVHKRNQLNSVSLRVRIGDKIMKKSMRRVGMECSISESETDDDHLEVVPKRKHPLTQKQNGSNFNSGDHSDTMTKLDFAANGVQLDEKGEFTA
ncbi:unnamed protein product [Rotaria sp. Silwood2]|nr:unnamed protein product [Rotaria sp. Silwood2]CAF3232765.1 unnamed protein product [Rotaria sp. Silwood2]CAF3421729.1 unnamed protein product [Rotaria sp. Silwood2]CAF4560885.1 unnamed protein product [Rotaria sp. Silwood2]CAF4624767.1 unnamed protein product [Rotaria sp. Silwood2]